MMKHSISMVKIRTVCLVYFSKIFKIPLKLIIIALNRSLSIAHLPDFELDGQVNEITEDHFCSLV
jgi:hypothetical protein